MFTICKYQQYLQEENDSSDGKNIWDLRTREGRP